MNNWKPETNQNTEVTAKTPKVCEVDAKTIYQYKFILNVKSSDFFFQFTKVSQEVESREKILLKA